VIANVLSAPAATVPSAQSTRPAANVHGASAETKLVPAGSRSVITTSCASDGPLLAILRLQVTSSPGTYLPGPSLTIAMSVSAATTRSPVSETGIASSSDVTLALLVSVVPSSTSASTVTGTVISTLALGVSVSTFQTTVVSPAPGPATGAVSVKPVAGFAVALPAAYLTPSGSTSLITSLLASVGPVFSILILNEEAVPATAVPPSGVLSIVRSGTTSVAVAVSGPVSYGPSSLPVAPESSLATADAVLTFASTPRPGSLTAAALGVALNVRTIWAPGAIVPAAPGVQVSLSPVGALTTLGSNATPSIAPEPAT
jgi:hypothetical protein